MRLLIATPALAALAVSGCAKAPAGAGVGPRLVVTLRFAGPINPNYYYFFLIRNADQQNPTNWPVAVVAPPYAGNGFATDEFPNSGTAAFTDFVEFGGGGQPTSSGYAVYHVAGYLKGNPNIPTSFRLRGDPDFAQRPDPVNGNTLQFEISLDRLRADTGECDTTVAGDCPQAKFLQVNVVATTKLPVDPNSVDPQKFTDAFGDQHLGSGSFNYALTVDTSQVGRVYQSSTSQADPNFEPDNDTYPAASDPGIELVAWQIQVQNR